VCRTLSLLSLLILTALRRFPKMFCWRTVGMLVPGFSLPATCVQRVEHPKRIQPSDAALMTSVNLVFFSTFEELKLPISCPMASHGAGVNKLYEPFPTPCLYVVSCLHGGHSFTDPLVPGWKVNAYHSSQVQPAQAHWLPSGRL
jgi:hypothetical protein